MAEKNEKTPITIPIQDFENKELLQKVLEELLDRTVEITEATIETAATRSECKENRYPRKRNNNAK